MGGEAMRAPHFVARFFRRDRMALLLPLTGAQAQFWYSAIRSGMAMIRRAHPWSCEAEAAARVRRGHCAQYKNTPHHRVHRNTATNLVHCFWSPTWTATPAAVATGLHGSPTRLAK